MYYFARSAKFFNEYGLKFYKNAYVSKGLDPPSPHVGKRKHLTDPLPPPFVLT